MVPKEVWELSHLELLDLSSNELEGLPAEVGAMTTLTSLNLSGNQIHVVPSPLTKCAHLDPVALFLLIPGAG